MKLLVIVTGDYGELGAAMYFLHRLETISRPMLLLPASLEHAIGATPELDVRTYRNLADLVGAFAIARPDAVLLASAYLLSINSGLSLTESARLLHFLKRRRVALLTTDPFLGLLRNIRALDFRDLQSRVGNRGSVLSASWRNMCRLYLARFQLRRWWHIYPAPTERMLRKPDARHLSYFNPAARYDDPDRQNPQQDPHQPAWLFVLSQVDFRMQFGVLGEWFVALLVDRLEDSIAQGRRAQLIGPRQLVDAVRMRLGTRADIIAHGDTTYAGYMHRLMAAEYAFFWNIYSFSVFHRVLGNRPTFFFDQGHLVQFVPAIGQEGVRLFYDGWRPSILALGEPLKRDELGQSETAVRLQFRHIVDGLLGCPSPQEVLDRIKAGTR